MSKRLTIEEFIKTLSKGSSGDVLVVNVVKNDGILRLDKTWQEIYDAFGRVGVAIHAPTTETGERELSAVQAVGWTASDGYYVTLNADLMITASSPEDYPQRYY